MNTTRRSALTLLAAVSLAPLGGCESFGINNTRILEVAAYKGNCVSLFEGLCLQTRSPGEADFTNLFEAPSGFIYEWGFDYVIVVEESQIENPPADGSSVRRRLERQVSKEPIVPGTQFDLTTPPTFLTMEAPGRYNIASETRELLCPETLACGELDTQIQAGTRLAFTLSFGDEPRDPIDIVAWAICSDDDYPVCSSS